MEYFPAMDEEQFEYIKTVIDEADYYVIITAGRYGSLAPDNVGYCEKEYRYALARSVPVIALLRRDWQSLNASKCESDPDRVSMLEKFRKDLNDHRLVQFWTDEMELCLVLLNS